MTEPSRDKPLVTVSVFLFGKPAWEIEGLEGSPVDLELLSAIASCGQELSRRLTRAAELGKQLVVKGWDGYGLLYDVEFYKSVTLKDAEEELKGLGIEPDEVSIREEDDSNGGPYGD
jgi:predicted regulator of Ras-like GTPase activity (Roadblock/LC7/MglB family)